jgi:hypothetical protein
MRFPSASLFFMAIGATAGCGDGDSSTPTPPDGSGTIQLQVVVYDSVFMGGAPARDFRNEAPVFDVRHGSTLSRTAPTLYGPQGMIHRYYAQAVTFTVPRDSVTRIDVSATGYASRTALQEPSLADSLTLEVPMVPNVPVMVYGGLCCASSDTVRVNAVVWDVHGWAHARVDSVIAFAGDTLPSIPDNARVLTRVDDLTSSLTYAWPGKHAMYPDYSLGLFLSDLDGGKSMISCRQSGNHFFCALTAEAAGN